MAEEYIQIDSKVIFAGLVAGIVASLWAIIPFFAAGAFNLIYITIILGVIILFVSLFALKSFKVGNLLKSGLLALVMFFVLSYVAVPGVSGLLLETESKAPINTEGLATLNLKVPNMFCQGCAYSVGTALEGIPGVASAQTDLDTKSAVVWYDPNVVSPETILSNEVVQGYGGYVE